MDIISALMKENLRVSDGSRWLVFDKMTGEWMVLERKHYARKNTVLCRSFIQDEAVDTLLKEE